MRRALYLAAIFVAVAFVFTGCGKKAAGPGGAENQKANETSVEEFQTTIEEMAKSGKPYQCDYVVNDPDGTQGGNQVGTLYFAGADNFRGDVKITTKETGEQMTHFIKTGETQYIWSDGQTTGMKFTVTKEEEAKAKESAQNSQQGVDTNMKVDLKCRKWSPDQSILTPPSSVKFNDLSEMMKAATGAAAGATGGNTGGAGINTKDIDMCAICGQLPAGTAQDSCKQANCK